MVFNLGIFFLMAPDISESYPSIRSFVGCLTDKPILNPYTRFRKTLFGFFSLARRGVARVTSPNFASRFWIDSCLDENRLRGTLAVIPKALHLNPIQKSKERRGKLPPSWTKMAAFNSPSQEHCSNQCLTCLWMFYWRWEPPRVLTGHSELSSQIFKHLQLIDVMHLSRTSKPLRSILMSRTSIYVWKQAVANDGLPPCTKDLNEPKLAELIFGRSCDVGVSAPKFVKKLNHFVSFFCFALHSGVGGMYLARK